MWILNIPMFVGIFVFIWSLVACYTTYEYLSSWTNDETQNIMPKFVEVFGIYWSRTYRYDEAMLQLLLGLMIALLAGALWPVAIPLAVALGVAYYIRHQKRKNKAKKV